MKRFFTKEEVEEFIDNPVESNIVESTRWSLTMETIGKKDGKYYRVFWSKGATECQENEIEEQEAEEVDLVEKVVKVWEAKP